jgi:sodium transport system permease protein
MSLRNIRVVYRKELTDLLRDRRTIISMIVIPVLVMPLMMIGFGGAAVKLVTKAQQETPEVMIVGGEDSPKIVGALKAFSTVKIVPTRADFTNQISEKLIRAAVEIPPGFDAALDHGEQRFVRIYNYAGEIKSEMGAQRLEWFLRDWRDTTVRDRLQARNLPASLVKPFEFAKVNVAPLQKVSGNVIGGIIPYIIILLCLTGAMYPAMDMTAGEKERGTIETLLCSPVARTDLVLGKFLMVLTASLATAFASLTSMAVTFGFAKNMFLGTPGAKAGLLAISVDPKAALAVFGVVLPVAVFFSAALLAISIFAKTMKEAQSYIGPLMMFVIVPAVAGMLPGMELSTKLALVPILNTSLVSKEIFTGVYHWGHIALIFASSCLYATVALFAAVKLFQREEVLFRT